MKILYLSSSSPLATTYFPHPTLDTQQILTFPCRRILDITAPYAALKTRLHCQPDYNTLLIPKPAPKPVATSTPIRERTFRVDINQCQNTSSDVLRLMDGLGLPVTPDIYSSLVAECTQKQDAGQAAELLVHLKRNRGMVGFVNGSSGLPFLNRILMMFVACGSLDVANQVFDKMPQRDSISLAIMVAGLVDTKLFSQALGLFVKMHRLLIHKQCNSALQVVMVCVLEACVQLKNIHLGKMIHGWMLKTGCCGELSVATALMEFYGRCRCLREANFVFFNQIEMAGHNDTRFWNIAIVNNCREAYLDEVIWIFREMGRAKVRKNDQTISDVLKACGRASDMGSYGGQIHANAIKLALDTHVSVMCSLVDMYGKSGLLKDAQKVFDMIAWKERNTGCWNAMATNLIRHGLQIEALKLLYKMKVAGVEPQQSLIEEVVVACGSEKLGVVSS